MTAILILLFLLQIKHCYADFVIQTYMQTIKKGVWLDPIGISHSMEHMICSMIVLVVYSFFITLNLFTVMWLCLAEGVLHYVIDFIKVKYGCKDNTKSAFWAQFGYDQAAHQITYLLMVYMLL